MTAQNSGNFIMIVVLKFFKKKWSDRLNIYKYFSVNNSNSKGTAWHPQYYQDSKKYHQFTRSVINGSVSDG